VTARTRAELVRRNTVLLVVAQAALLTASAIFFTLAVVEIVDLTDRERWGGVLLALFNLFAAASALLVGRLMDRVGRRPGLALGHFLLGIGGALSAVAVAAESPWALLAAAVPAGAGLGAGLLGRVAVADMYPSEQRGRSVGLLIAAGTLGAIGGPPVLAAVQALTASAYAPWLLVPAVELVGVTAVLLLRPDPRALAVEGHVQGSDSGARLQRAGRSLGELLSVRPLRAAVVAIGVAQAAMVAVMGVTPVVIDDRGGSELAIALVISVHMAGMFAVAPFVGAALDRFGRRYGLLAGVAISAAGAILGSFTTVTPLVGLGLFLVGLGWSASYLGATATISDLTQVGERGGALGFSDLFTSLAAATGALAGGFVLESSGIAVVGIVMAALMLPALLLVFPLREPAPGRWSLEPAAGA
jgi:MFS family permease